MKRASSQTQHGLSPSLSEARLFPPAKRRSWERELVAFQIDELNGIFDPLQDPPRTGPRRQARFCEARARIDSILRVATWAPDVYLRHAWAIAKEVRPEPEDHFGAAILLLALNSDAAPMRSWLASLPANVVTTARDLGFDFPAWSRPAPLPRANRRRRAASVVPLPRR